MYLGLYEKYLKDHFELVISEKSGSFVKSGHLVERRTDLNVPIRDYIPRFSGEDYCDNFGLQWSRFKSLQLDSKNGHPHSRNRLIQNTRWSLDALKEKSVIECGCGPGRFTEVFVSTGADVVAVDMSSAIDVNLQNNGHRENLLLLQGDISRLPFFYGKFDYVFCYGVLQHTPSPEKTFHELVKYLKAGGDISVDIYRKTNLPLYWNAPKYLWRPLTTRIKKEKLLTFIQWYIPKYIGFDTVIKRIRGGAYLSGLIPIPCWNYLNMGYSKEERIQHAVMDTFDALSPAYDIPKTRREVRGWFKNHQELIDVEVFYGSNGIVGNAAKISV